jgi:cytoskeletal protein RodZ
MFIEKTPSNNLQDLKKIREDLGLSLEDLFQRTRVRAVYLEAIENREFDLLPVPVYSKNFIKIYASALGIESEPLIKEYDEYLNSRKEMPVQREESDEEKFSLAKKIGKKTYLIIAFVLITVIVAQWMISKKNESNLEIASPAGIKTGTIQENKEQGSNTTVNQQAPVPTVVEQTEDVKPPDIKPPDMKQSDIKQSDIKQSDIKQPTTEKKTVEIKEQKESIAAPSKVPPQAVNVPSSSDKKALLLTLTATEETWLSIKADDNPSYQVLLKAGQKIEHRAKSFEIDVGNAGGIKVNFNGKDMGSLGKNGQVVRLRLP